MWGKVHDDTPRSRDQDIVVFIKQAGLSRSLTYSLLLTSENIAPCGSIP